MSLSGGVYDKDYNLLSAKDYTVLNSFELKYKRFSLSQFAPAKQIDLSEELSKRVHELNGDAIVNLKVRGAKPASLTIPLVTFFTWPIQYFTFGLTVLPLEVMAVVKGDVIKLNPKKAVVAAPPAPASMDAPADAPVDAPAKVKRQRKKASNKTPKE